MIKLKFHKAIQKYTNGISEYIFNDIDSYYSLVTSCISIFPEFEKLIKSFVKNVNKHEELLLVKDGKIIPLEEFWFKPEKNTEIYLCPIIYGGSGKIITVIAVIALIAISIYAPQIGIALFSQAGTSATTAAGFAIGASTTGLAATSAALINSTALGLALSLTVSLFMPQPKAPSIGVVSDSGSRRNNNMFEGLQNTTSQQNLLSLNYGLVRIPGQFISGYIKTIGHGQDDIIQVGNLF